MFVSFAVVMNVAYWQKRFSDLIQLCNAREKDLDQLRLWRLNKLLHHLRRLKCGRLFTRVVGANSKLKQFMRVTPPSPLAYCVPLYFGIAYCVPPFFGLAYCVPFNNKKTTILGVSIYIKKLKLQYVVCTCTVILKNISFDVALFAC